ncbi:MAG: hypothetical protein KDA20_03410 [Phycisphaerales bacterium]|nr:hypothetical protein [Phycisphaerales bacterium]
MAWFVSENKIQFRERGKAGHCSLCGAFLNEVRECGVCSWVERADLDEPFFKPRAENENIGPDDAFRIVLRFGIDAFKRYRIASEDERSEMLRLTSRSGWPKNEYGKSACCCCGYHTLESAPSSDDFCPVCGWFDTSVDWNMFWWEMKKGQPKIETARENFERIGAIEESEVEDCRPPTPEELPRHDWASDDRPYRKPPR